MKKTIIVLLLAALIGTSIFYLKNQGGRLPSSTAEFSENGVSRITIPDAPMDGETKKNIKKIILSTLDWFYKSPVLTISFENIEVQTNQLTKTFCEFYPQLEIVLEATDITYNGDHPEIIFSQTCEAAKNNTLARRHANELSLDFFSDSELLKKIATNPTVPNSKIRFLNWDSEIPLQWRLKQINFLPENNTKNSTLMLVKYEILSQLGYNIEFKISIPAQ